MILGLGSRRQSLILLALFAIMLVLVFYKQNDLPDVPKFTDFKSVLPRERLNVHPAKKDNLEKTHLLLPAPAGIASMCKTLLTASVLGYPVPTLIGYNQSYDDDQLINGGRHLSKISQVLEWLESQHSEKKDDLVVIVDAYGGFNYQNSRAGIQSHLEGDAWFQLPFEILVQRYQAVVEQANRDLAASMGDAFEAEGINQKIVFAASKQCTPNNAESASCYPVPDSPLPSALYGKFTDSPDANYTTHRQRYLSSAYVIGPMNDMLSLFRRANERATSERERSLQMPSDPAFESSLYMGSDQAIFHRIFGEQEFQREAIRRRHGARARGKTVVEGVSVKDVLEPDFAHEELKIKDGKPDEFGMFIDYWSDLGMQTTHSLDDGLWLTYKDNLPEKQLAASRPTGQPWLCGPQVSGKLPVEVVNSTSMPRSAVPDDAPFRPLRGWDEIPLYTNVCLDTIPVIVNHAGDQTERGRDWPEMWIQPHARRLIDDVLASKQKDSHGSVRGGAIVGPGGRYQTWKDLCPASLDNELYRDYYDEV
ncbi:hypothetical protein GMORB2_1262 [Geosmithia morbida]|uniref:Uncharacterized protein n=1 Tax=Geosmithia morbida TaxID=1094350 RepID=A0A9P5D6W8_9HYPO|nr:uncharacterized protein GMORB2_1262 [Geosmithia morbida]KAF4126016.1 hypothetical protein GMORB2_1262 [Geosmithia morbida]